MKRVNYTCWVTTDGQQFAVRSLAETHQTTLHIIAALSGVGDLTAVQMEEAVKCLRDSPDLIIMRKARS